MDTNDSLQVAGAAWDLTHLYCDAQDPQLDADLTAAQQRAEAFAARYRGSIDVPGGPAPEWVAAALAELEAIGELADKPAVFAGLLHAADSRPPAHGALMAMTQERGSDISNQLLFLDLE